MALPFDIRLIAAEVSDDANEGIPAGSAAQVPHATRPSRAISIPPALVDRVRAHDVDALRDLVHLAYIPLVRFARTIVRLYDTAEDVVQDVFTRVWEKGDRWNPGPDAAAYLFASVRNQSLKELRRQQRAIRREERAQTETLEFSQGVPRDLTTNPLDRVVEEEADAERLRTVLSVLATCTERQRVVYDLRYHRGLKTTAIADILGISVKSADQLVRRVTQLVRERLRARIGQDWGA